jgi:hypothetical protein
VKLFQKPYQRKSSLKRNLNNTRVNLANQNSKLSISLPRHRETKWRKNDNSDEEVSSFKTLELFRKEMSKCRCNYIPKSQQRVFVFTEAH